MPSQDASPTKFRGMRFNVRLIPSLTVSSSRHKIEFLGQTVVHAGYATDCFTLLVLSMEEIRCHTIAIELWVDVCVGVCNLTSWKSWDASIAVLCFPQQASAAQNWGNLGYLINGEKDVLLLLSLGKDNTRGGGIRRLFLQTNMDSGKKNFFWSVFRIAKKINR